MASKLDGCPSGVYRERLGCFKDAEAEKNEMIIELIDNLEKARTDCRQTSLDLERERVVCRSLQGRNEELETLTRAQNGRGFALVLIDADADDYIFQERFLNRNEAGGVEAADELRGRVKEYLRQIKVDVDNTDIVVKAYADIKNLSAACIRNGKMKSGSNLSLFAHGFNQRQGLFDFVNVGPGKEGADNKIRECLSFFVGNWQCKHIILGACHDGGYAQFLGRFAADAAIRDRMTLLRGVNLHTRIAELGFQKFLRLETVFAPHGLPAVPVTRSPAPATSGATSGQNLRANESINPAPLSDRFGAVIRDEAGKRLDKELKVDINSGYLNVLRENKLCAYYYLRGRCNGGCDKNHVPAPLKAKEFDALWYFARGGLCYKTRKGKDCDDPMCVYRHEEGCQLGSGKV